MRDVAMAPTEGGMEAAVSGPGNEEDAVPIVADPVAFGLHSLTPLTEFVSSKVEWVLDTVSVGHSLGKATTQRCRWSWIGTIGCS